MGDHSPDDSISYFEVEEDELTPDDKMLRFVDKNGLVPSSSGKADRKKQQNNFDKSSASALQGHLYIEIGVEINGFIDSGKYQKKLWHKGDLR